MDLKRSTEAYKVLTKQKNSPVQLVSADPKVETLEIYKVAKPKGNNFNYTRTSLVLVSLILDGKPIEPRSIQPGTCSESKDILKVL